jgi:hypothetical protein
MRELLLWMCAAMPILSNLVECCKLVVLQFCIAVKVQPVPDAVKVGLCQRRVVGQPIGRQVASWTCRDCTGQLQAMQQDDCGK